MYLKNHNHIILSFCVECTNFIHGLHWGLGFRTRICGWVFQKWGFGLKTGALDWAFGFWTHQHHKISPTTVELIIHVIK